MSEPEMTREAYLELSDEERLRQGVLQLNDLAERGSSLTEAGAGLAEPNRVHYYTADGAPASPLRRRGKRPA